MRPVCISTFLHRVLTTPNSHPHPIARPPSTEIMQSILDDAHESYSPSIILELPSTEHTDMENSLDTVKAWVEKYLAEAAQ